MTSYRWTEGRQQSKAASTLLFVQDSTREGSMLLHGKDWKPGNEVSKLPVALIDKISRKWGVGTEQICNSFMQLTSSYSCRVQVTQSLLLNLSHDCPVIATT